MPKQNINLKTFRRDIDLEQKLAQLISQALTTKNIADALYGLKDNPDYKNILTSPALVPEFANLLIGDVRQEIDLLHDDFTRDYYNNNPKGFQEYVAQLTGKEEWRTIDWYKGERIEITYLPYTGGVVNVTDIVKIEKI